MCWSLFPKAATFIPTISTLLTCFVLFLNSGVCIQSCRLGWTIRFYWPHITQSFKGTSYNWQNRISWRNRKRQSQFSIGFRGKIFFDFIQLQKCQIVIYFLNLPNFQVPIEAVPPPVTSWYQNDKELLTRDGLKVVHNPCMAKLMFIPALRPLSGKYLLKAKNQVWIL